MSKSMSIPQANILIGADGTVRLADFNISVDTRTRTSAKFVTASRTVVGYTPGFDAPELMRTGATVQTDMYAFGKTLESVIAERDADCQDLVFFCRFRL